MHYVSLLVEFLRGRPAVVFWTVALTQAALWTLIPAIFYSAPPADAAMLLAIGREFVLGSYLGVLLLGMVTTGLTVMNQPSWIAALVQGLVLIAAVAGVAVRRRGALGR